MSAPSPPVRLFLGSSSEGREVARNLQVDLGDSIQVVRWDQSVFEPGGYTLDSLIATATSVDFAVLVATPDDTTVSRGETKALRARQHRVGVRAVRWCARPGTDLPAGHRGTQTADRRPRPDAAALPPPVEPTRRGERRRSPDRGAGPQRLGPLARGSAPGGSSTPRTALDREIDLLCNNAVTQGWTVKTNSATTLRLRSPRARVLTLSKGQPETTRADLRRFAAELRAAGMRVSSGVRRPVAESPL